MKRIVIVGKNSYIGTSCKQYLDSFDNEYYLEELDTLDDTWREFDFSSFDVVFHVAGLAHSTPSVDQRDLYYEVNTNLTYDVAEKAKRQGVKQFIFMSSVIVYGSGTLGKEVVIRENTPLVPDNFYGDSKKQAEIKLEKLEDDKFKIVILRPPMIYGKNSKGNYPRLAMLSRKTPIFPKIENERSMLYLGNLLSFIKIIIDNQDSGVFHPQNEEYVCTSVMVKEIAEIHGKSIHLTKVFNPIIKLFHKQTSINKLFGNFVIDKKLSNYPVNYCEYDFNKSLKETEGK